MWQITDALWLERPDKMWLVLLKYLNNRIVAHVIKWHGHSELSKWIPIKGKLVSDDLRSRE